MKRTTAKKCIPSKNKWCLTIQDVADMENPEAIGLAISQVVNVSTGKKGFGLRYGLPKKRWKELGGKFAWANYCPFCGANTEKRIA